MRWQETDEQGSFNIRDVSSMEILMAENFHYFFKLRYKTELKAL